MLCYGTNGRRRKRTYIKSCYVRDCDIKKTIINIGGRLKSRDSTSICYFRIAFRFEYIIVKFWTQLGWFQNGFFFRLNSNAPRRFVRYAYLTGVLLAFLVARTYHVIGDLLGRVTHFLAVLVGYNRHIHLLKDVGRLFTLAQPAPSDHGAFDADVRWVGYGPNGFVFRV